MTQYSLDYLDALVDMGFPFNPDYNSRNHVGSTFFQWTRYRTSGQRSNQTSPLTRDSSQSAYLEPFLNAGPASNLLVLESSAVLKILFDKERSNGTDARAIGVRFLCGGHVFDAQAAKEVIVSGGGLGTPIILQRSGIGPKSLLDSVGVKIVADNAHVGQNFVDHFTVKAVFATTVSFPFSDP
jgi:choline dehydrogenase